MDCEKLESVLMDELYGELDEITSAAVKRHVAGCARCAALLGGLRATRRVAELPMIEVPVGLEERILVAAAAHAPRGSALQWRFARVLSLAGTWAMRPQTAMAAVSLVMIGTSVLLLRGRSSRAPANAEMIVTEEGTPAPVASAPAIEPTGAAAAPPAAASAPGVVAAAPAPEPAADFRLRAAKAPPRADDEIGASPTPMAIATRAPSGGGGGMAGAGAGASGALASAPAQERARFAEAPGPSPFDANGELAEARAARDDAARHGLPCPSVARFDDVVNRAGGTAAGWDAVFEGALCYESNGDFASARNRLNVLLRVDPYKDRARAQLNQLNRRQQPASAAAAPAAKPAAPATADEPASGAP